MGSRSRHGGYWCPENAEPQRKVPKLARPPKKLVVRNRHVQHAKHKRTRKDQRHVQEETC